MKCFLPSEQWYLGRMPATFFPGSPALGFFWLNLRSRLVERRDTGKGLEKVNSHFFAKFWFWGFFIHDMHDIFFRSLWSTSSEICNDFCQARELGRYGAATQLAKRGGSTWNFEDMQLTDQKKRKRSKSVMIFKRHLEKVWNLFLFSFQKCLNIGWKCFA